MSDSSLPPPTLPHAGTYVRELPVTLERLYENALDWEHLPYLHASSFCGIDCVEAGEWGWRAWADLQPEQNPQRVLLELSLDRRCHRWITRTLEGAGAGSEIWTHAFALGERRTEVVVDFFVAGIAADDAAVVGEFYKDLYATLYDEDVAMMCERQVQLDRLKSKRASPAEASVRLGSIAEVRARLPFCADVGGRRFRVVEFAGKLLAHSALCPHLLGPLDRPPGADGVLECHWHGYRFDLHTGECVSGQACRLSAPPLISVDSASDSVVLSWRRPHGD